MLTENCILVNNATAVNIETVLQNLAAMYANTGFTDEINLFEENNSDQQFLVTFKTSPDFDRFAYFVNYIHYPEGFEVWDAVVTGFYRVKPDETTEYFHSGEWLQLYVSKTDNAYDNVSIVNASNKSLVFDFGGKIKQLPFTEEIFHLPDIQKSNCALLKVIVPVAPAQEEITKPWWKFW